MPSLLVRLIVDDFAAWSDAFEAGSETRRANGSSGGAVFRNAAGPDEILALLDWDDLDRARLLVQSDHVDEAMGLAAATQRADFWFLDDASRPGR